eukprot:2394208-Alexandrium_andersonii.AAC.1
MHGRSRPHGEQHIGNFASNRFGLPVTALGNCRRFSATLGGVWQLKTVSSTLGLRQAVHSAA